MSDVFLAKWHVRREWHGDVEDWDQEVWLVSMTLLTDCLSSGRVIWTIKRFFLGGLSLFPTHKDKPDKPRESPNYNNSSVEHLTTDQEIFKNKVIFVQWMGMNHTASRMNQHTTVWVNLTDALAKKELRQQGLHSTWVPFARCTNRPT